MEAESVERSLRDIEYRIYYSPSDNPLQTFYLPTLAATVRYDRSAGYFRSSALAAAAAGIVRLIANGGQMRLLVGAELSEDDVQAIREGYELRQRLETVLLGAFPDPSEGPLKQRLEALAWMVANGTLDIKVVLPLDSEGYPIPGPAAQDYYHAKKGIFTDVYGDHVGFTGSINESAQGWMGNFEEFSVSTSWGGEYERNLLGNLQASFNRLWEGRDSHWLAVDLPRAVQQRLVKYAPSTPPSRDALEPPEKKKIGDGETDFAVASQRERTLFQFLRDAPYLLTARDLAEQTSNVVPWPHQTRVSRAIIERFPDNVMLADEVGLGKTIEAGLVIRQLVLSGRVQRCLILAPASVMRQWQEELYEKFNLNIPLFDSGQITNVYGEAVAVTNKPWDECDLLIASSHLARRRERVDELLAAERWDLLVVDEAHHARRKDFLQPQYRPNRLLSLLNALRAESKYRAIMLMTATPMQVHPVEVWDLLKLLGLSGKWGADENYFLEFFQQLRKPYQGTDWKFVFDMVADSLASDGHLDPHFLSEMEADLGPVLTDTIRHLPRQNQGVTKSIRHLHGKARPYVTELARRHTPINRYVYRNTRDLLRKYVERGILKASVPRRKPHIQRIPFRQEEEDLYLRITDYIAHFYQKYEEERRGLGFIMTVYRKRLTSSFYAIRRSLERRRAWLEGLLTSSEQLMEAEDITEDEELYAELEEAGYDLEKLEELSDAQKANFQMELDYLNNFISDLQDLSQADSKLTFLKDQLEELFAQRDTVLVFTQYTDTMDYLRDQLRTVYGGSVACYSGRGGEKWNGIAWVPTTKEIVKNEFREGQIKILLCTESASEGLNLQTCGVLINYDMPWNPMRVEQRIGRIDRIGQKYPTVWIHNYFYEDSIEDRIYQALKDRINWFETVVGDLQPILAEVGEVTRKLAMLPAEAQAAELEAKLREIRTKIDGAKTQAFSLDENLRPDDPDGAVQSPVSLKDIAQVILNAAATRRFFKPHPEIPDAYCLSWDDTEMEVTFSRECFDRYPNTLQFLSYGNPLLDALLQSVPEPDETVAGLQRYIADDPFPLRGWYRTVDGKVAAVENISELRRALRQSSDIDIPAELTTTCRATFEAEVETIREVYEQRLQIHIDRRRKTLRARARQLLLQAATVEIALGNQEDLFTRGNYPKSFSESSVSELARHNDKVWNWLLEIGYEESLRPDPESQFYAKIQGHKPEKLNGLLGSIKKEGRGVVKEWLSTEQKGDRNKS